MALFSASVGNSPRRAPPRLKVLLALAALTPSETDRPLIGIELLNHRTLVQVRANAPLERFFDRGSLPIVQAPSGSLKNPRALFHLASKTIEAELITRDRGAVQRFELRAREALEDPFRLELLDGDISVAEFSLRWAPGPEDIPAVAEAVALRKQLRPEDARAHLIRALENASAWECIWLHRELGNLAYMSGDHRTAEDRWLAAAAAAEKAGAWTEFGNRIRGVAFLRYLRGDYFGAIPLIDQAREVDVRLGDTCSIEQDEYYLGLVDMRLGFHERAHEHLRRAAELARTSGTELDWIEVAQVLAGDLIEVGRYREALSLMDSAKLPEAAGPSALARHLANRAWVRLNARQAGVLQVDLTKIEEEYVHVLSLLETAGTPQRRANVLSRLAFIAYARADLDEAERRLGTLDRMPTDQTIAVRDFSELVRARVAIERGGIDEARHILHAISESESPDKLMARILLGEIAFREGRLDEACSRFDAALSEVEERSERLQGPRTRSALLFKYREIAERLADTLIHRGSAGEAFAVLDRSRGAAIEDLEAQLLPELDPRGWLTHLQVRTELEAREKRGCEIERSSQRSRCAAEIEALRAESEEALRQVYAAGGRSLTLRRARADLVEQLQRALAADEIVFSVFRLGSEWISFRLDDRVLNHQRWKEPPWAALEELDGRHHVYIVLGEGTEPFDPWIPLAQRVSMSRLPYAGILLEQRAQSFHGSLFAADADGTLPDARSQAEALAAQTPDSVLMVGLDATPAAFLDAMRGRALVHAAVHGSIRDRDPWNTKIIFAGGHGLELHDFLAARASARLVVLAACWSGVEYREGDLGIVEALLASGSRSVLAAIGELKPAPAIRFLDRFYRAGGAMNPAAAMRDAARASIDDGDDSWRDFRLWGLR